MRLPSKSILAFTLTPILLLVSLANVGSNGHSLIPPSAEWTVMVFMNGDNNLEKYALRDFIEMASITYNPQVNVVVQMDRIPGESYAYGDWTHTLRFKLAQEMTPTTSEALSPQESELPEKTEINMGDPDSLKSFVKWARKKYPARRYMLILWDHGDGWLKRHTVRIRRNSRAVKAGRLDDFKAANAIRVARGAEPLPQDFSLDQTLDAPHRSISLDVSNNDRLYMREVQEALEGTMGANGLNVLGFDACLMQMVENGFAMRRVANVMVGSEELEPGDGWQYNHWLAILMANPTMDAVRLGKELVDSYKDTYSTTNPDTTLSAVDLSGNRMQTLADAISALADGLKANLDVDLNSIKDARKDSREYAPGEGYHGVDLHRFCEQLLARTTIPLLRDRAQTVKQMLEDPTFIINWYAGDDRRGQFGSRGLAIYFPESKGDYLADRYGYAYRDDNKKYPVEFVQRHRWDNFLHAYFERVP
jgi:hypothetical protein